VAAGVVAVVAVEGLADSVVEADSVAVVAGRAGEKNRSHK
jgi:hypothetical protein